MMNEAQFEERIAAIRKRFVSKLAAKIDEAEASLPRLTGDSAVAVQGVAAAYRQFHDVCGIGATIGFNATGQAAKAVEAVLAGPFRDHRSLSADEMAGLLDALTALRAAAVSEMQSIDSNRELVS